MGFSKEPVDPARQAAERDRHARPQRPLGQGKALAGRLARRGRPGKSQAFQTKAAADKHWQGLESGRAREVLAEVVRKRTVEHAVEEGTRRYKERADGPAAAEEGPG